MATAKALSAAERAAEQADKAAMHAREALSRATVRDPRTMSFILSTDPLRIEFERATIAARNADAKAAAARERLGKLRAGNGKADPGEARAALKAAIAEVSRTEKAASANRAEIERKRVLAARTRDELERAEAGAEQANDETTAAAMAQARGKLAAAEDAARAAQNMHRRLQQKQRDLDGQAESAREKLAQAVNAVIKHELPVRKLLARTQQAHDQLAALRVILRKLLWDKLLDGDDKGAAEAMLRAELPPPIGQGSWINWDATPEGKAWGAMRQALAGDAAAAVAVEIDEL
jgi:chromosome segregation ATPase